MDYKKLSLEILEKIGGKENIKHLTHCATRLRLEFYDNSKVKAKDIENLNGVIKVVDGGGQFQIVIGNDVQQVYRTIQKNLTTKDENKEKTSKVKENSQKSSLISRFISVISTTFTPMIPAITGAGMIKALLAVLTISGILSSESQTYYILNTIADAAFYFMPMLLAYGAALKFESSPILAITIAGVLLHPNLGSLMQANQPVHFMGLPLRLTDYAGSVLPIIITVWIMSYIENFAEKVSPSIIKFFTKPLIILFLTAPLALIVIGPFGTYLNDLVMMAAERINARASWLIPMLMGAFQPFLVVTGTAWAMTPIATMQLTNNGQEMINGPGMLASNIAQGGATLCVAFKTKNSKLKQLASSAGITALLGITEPSLYGVTLKLKRPLIASMIGGGIAGVYAGVVGLVRYAFVSPGLAALPAFIGKNPMNIVHALITCLIAFVAAFIATWILGFEDPVEEDGENNNTLSVKKKTNVKSPMSGKVIALKDVNDEVFSNELLGKGVAIIPNEGRVISPFNGIIEALVDTKHAIAIESENGIKILIHIGIDTVNLEGKHFYTNLKEGDRVTAGQEIVTFDLEEIKKLGYDVTTPIIVVDSEDYQSIKTLTKENVKFEDIILEIN